MRGPNETRPASAPPRLSLVLPVFRGARFIRRSLEDFVSWLDRSGSAYELIVVDDYSDDATAAIVEEFQGLRPGAVRLLRQERNMGKGAAVRRGMLEARGQFCIYMDSDIPYSLDTMGEMIRMLESGADVVIVSRVHPQSRYIVSPRMFGSLATRHWLSRIGNRIIRLVVPGITDTQAGLKGFRKEAADHIFSRQRLNRFSSDPETLRIAQLAGYRIVEIPVDYHYETELTTVEFAGDSFRMIRDLIRIKLWERRGTWKRGSS